MKKVILAAVAALLMVGSIHAGDAPMTEVQCKDAFSKCTDDACKQDLVKKGCKAE